MFWHEFNHGAVPSNYIYIKKYIAKMKPELTEEKTQRSSSHGVQTASLFSNGTKKTFPVQRAWASSKGKRNHVNTCVSSLSEKWEGLRLWPRANEGWAFMPMVHTRASHFHQSHWEGKKKLICILLSSAGHKMSLDRSHVWVTGGVNVLRRAYNEKRNN